MTAAVLATTRQARTLVDGTLRVTLDIEPTDAQRAFAFLGSPTQLVGIAPVNKEAAQQAPEPMTTKRTLSQRCAIRCGEKGFMQWLGAGSPLAAAALVRDRCQISSRSELDTDPVAAETWHALEQEYLAYERGYR